MSHRQRFMEKVNRDGPVHPVHGQCWIWTAGTWGLGYGQFQLRGKPQSAHRVSYELHCGSARGLWVLHKCDERLCVNPNHLFLGTAAKNSEDMVRKGRSHKPKGRKNNQVKLTEFTVNRIRKSKLPGVVLARIHDISTAQVCRIRKGDRWTTP